MNNLEISSEPATAPKKSTKKTAKRKMSAAQRKALSDAAKARIAAKKASEVDRVEYYRDNRDGTYSLIKGGVDVGQGLPAAPAPPPAPLTPSPAVLSLQDQVVQLVSQRHQARTFLNEAHNAYLAAQAKFQAAENELKGIEAEVQYRISLIAQLENRPAQVNYSPSPAPLQFPPSGSMAGVSSEPSQPAQPAQRSQQTYAVGDANDIRKELRGMM